MVKKKKLKILAAADLHGSPSAAEDLSKKAQKEKVDLVILGGDLHGFSETRGFIEPFKKRNQKVIFIPGNWDSSSEIAMVESIYDIKNFDEKYVTYQDVNIVGVGTKDFKMSLDEKRTLDNLIKNFDRIKNKKTKKVLVSHLHARGTKAEFTGIPGEEVLQKAIMYFEPDVFISAHIHPAEGLEQKIGKTQVFHVGRKGKVFEI